MRSTDAFSPDAAFDVVPDWIALVDTDRVIARILAVADVVEAMASHRPYRPALGVGAAMDEIGWGAGRLYDEKVVAACQRVVRRGIVDLSEPQA